MMRDVASTLILVLGFAVLGCGGAQGNAADPSTASDDVGEAEDEAEWDEAEPSDWDDSEAAGGDESSTEVEQEDEAGAGECHESTDKLVLAIDRSAVNLDVGRLEATMDGPVCKIVLTITRKSGLPTVEKTFRYAGRQRELRWNPVPPDEIEKVEVRAYAENNAYSGVKIVPWSVTIKHKEVEFDTDKAVIRRSEVPSLEDSLAKIKQVLDTVKGKGLGRITLFLAGHTDTQGSKEHNLNLSRRRAQAIGKWFMQRGLCIPIAVEGFGESALKKMTADEVDEQENRRVDYILAVEPPMTKKGITPTWKFISQGC
jgi:outer membrane protein OmpA-like peptidoglycan-associated protein